MVFEDDALGRVQRGELVEFLRRFPVISRDALNAKHFVEGEKFFAVARRADAGAEPVAVAQAELPLGLLGHKNVLRERAEIVARPTEEAAALRGKFEHAVGEKLGAAGGVGFEQIADEVMPGAVGIDAEMQRLGASEDGRERLGVQFVDPELLWRGGCGARFAKSFSCRRG